MSRHHQAAHSENHHGGVKPKRSEVGEGHNRVAVDEAVMFLQVVRTLAFASIDLVVTVVQQCDDPVAGAQTVVGHVVVEEGTKMNATRRTREVIPKQS